MGLYYKSTRNSNLKVTASEAILKGLAPDGGLFVPSELPKLDVSMSDLKGKTYQEIAYLVMKQFLTDFTEEELKSCIDKAYDSKFDTEEIAPLVKVDDTYYMELFHGATIAFKDMALSILPHLMTTSAKKNDVKNEIVILTATSGDTGKAALAGFADVEGTRIIVFYPKNGVSKVQELQMVTQRGENVNVVAIHGNFDNAQSGVKAMFEDKELAEELAKKGYQFSSANSINIGRLVPQVVYYVNAYAKLLENEEIEDGEKINVVVPTGNFGNILAAYYAKQMGVPIDKLVYYVNAYAKLLENEEIEDGEKINVVVPTGNFGNILAAYYAKQMGVPIDKLVCASNDNKVLFDFFQTGDYDRNREFILTTSPSMDILISSNLERLLYRISGDNDQKTKDMMEALKSTGKYTITEDMKARLDDFAAGYATEEECAQNIKKVYDKTGYVMDTHTSVASYVCECYQKNSGDNKKCVIASTASPYKFVKSVMSAIDPKYADQDEFSLLKVLEETSGREMPQAIKDILNANILHDLECDADKMKDTVKNILEV